ncbi:hypothetical protein APHAL10511_005099 [Amanita phalloides]|nr:hypothetical protein APHAL10511_005099 [Amanita phalloides]
MSKEQGRDVTPEWRLMTIGRGSLANVSILTGRTIAFKHVIVQARKQELITEFRTLCAVYNQCDSDSFFSIPQAHAYYDPDDAQSYSFTGRRQSPGSGSTSRRRLLGPSLIREEDFELLGLETAAYAMDQVQPLPLKFAQVVRNLFYPDTAKAAPVPSLCRIYFGKVISDVGREGQPRRFFNSSNFPLDVGRYQKAVDADAAGLYPDVKDIAYGMGEMLGRLHGRAGYDGRDIEFVLGGRGFSDTSFYVIDFNQVREWNRTMEQIPILVQAFFSNDPYYPRPIPDNPLYAEFKSGYLDGYPADLVELALSFFTAIEAEQAQRGRQ